jgi:hypothetical protein
MKRILTIAISILLMFSLVACGATCSQGPQGEHGIQGEQGAPGVNGITPMLKIGEDNYWYVSYDNGATWASFGVKANGEQGEKGENGEDGHTPIITIGENHNWFIDGVDTGVKAKGEDGEEDDSGHWNLVEYAEFGMNKWFDAKKSNGNYQGGGFYTYCNIPVVSGATYYIGPSFGGNYVRFINWSSEKYLFDNNGAIIMDDDEISSVTIETRGPSSNASQTAPLGAKYCTVTYYVGYPHDGSTPPMIISDCYFTSIENGISEDVLKQIDQNTEDIQNLSNKNTNLDQYNFIQKARKAVINFQFDDANLVGDTICKNIFDEFGYKCDFALPSGVAADVAKTKVYLNFQNQGFGILSHSTDGAGMSSIADDNIKQKYIKKMKDSYIILRNAGFNIHGWVTPSSGLHDDLYDALAEIYDYGFGTGQSTSQYHKFGEEEYIAHMSRIGIESLLILKTDPTTADLKDFVKTYIASLWGVSITTDISNQLVIIGNVSFDTLVANAIIDGYTEATIVDGALNADCLTYLQEIWGVSTSNSTLLVDSENSIITLTPTFKTCCEREGMKNIKNYIDTAIITNSFISFYAHNTYSTEGSENGYGINLSKYTREILQYCQKVGANVLNSADAMRDYFSFRYTDFLELKGIID